ncbi:MAG: helicase HerA-like domain-containing protein [Thermoanaerobaculia bacterium]
MTTFDETFRAAFDFSGLSIDIGHVIQEGTPKGTLPVRIPLGIMNRHGLIAGSTGTGKTRTLQLLAEGLSRNGVPVFLADVKGDLAGMSQAGQPNEKILARVKSVGREFTPEAFPVEFFSLTGTHGTQVRATITSFGPILLGKVLDLSDVQQSVLAMVFQYCDDRKLPLLDFKDLRDVLQYLGAEGKADLKQYGSMSSQTVGVLIRKMIELEQQGAGKFFGEPELDINDLMRVSGGKGVVNVLSLNDVQDKPRLWSTFLMWLLGQFYYHLPEVGDPEKPKLVFFFDEAHLLFEDASSVLQQHIEQVARLIRSKGIGVFFITQTPKDIDEDVLAQLGNRVQHAVRAFTPKDAKDLKATASTYPTSPFYDVGKTLTSLGTGEAIVSVLSPKGTPTPTAVVQILPPSSSMSAIDENGYQQVIGRSAIASKYVNAIDRESAHEILQKKLGATPAAATPAAGSAPRNAPAEKTVFQEVLGSPLAKSVVRAASTQVARTVTQQLVRGIFGMLKGR